ncbi:hypothetical protein GCM10010231_45470 [Streptomyces sindenensis]|nr:hypothetical protein GCM10010231_45470 [Streptomyces sindenensis]
MSTGKSEEREKGSATQHSPKQLPQSDCRSGWAAYEVRWDKTLTPGGVRCRQRCAAAVRPIVPDARNAVCPRGPGQPSGRRSPRS